MGGASAVLAAALAALSACSSWQRRGRRASKAVPRGRGACGLPATRARVDRLRGRLRPVLAADLRPARDRRRRVEHDRPAAAARRGRRDRLLRPQVPAARRHAGEAVRPERRSRRRRTRSSTLAVASTGCQTPVIAENELFGADLVTPWSATNTQYRADVLAYLTRLAAARRRPVPPDLEAAVHRRRRRRLVAAGLEGRRASSRRSTSTRRSSRSRGRPCVAAAARRLPQGDREPTPRSASPPPGSGSCSASRSRAGAGGREHLQPSSAWFRVVKWQALAAKQVAAETGVGTVWSWGWGTWGAASADPDKPAAACVYLWVRNPSLCDGPTAAGAGLRRVADRGPDPPPRRDALHGRRASRSPTGRSPASAPSPATPSWPRARSSAVSPRARSAPVSTRQILDAEHGDRREPVPREPLARTSRALARGARDAAAGARDHRRRAAPRGDHRDARRARADREPDRRTSTRATPRRRRAR